MICIPPQHTRMHTRTHTEVLREGDELLEVNGIPVMGRSTDEIVRLMVSTPYSRDICIQAMKLIEVLGVKPCVLYSATWVPA